MNKFFLSYSKSLVNSSSIFRTSMWPFADAISIYMDKNLRIQLINFTISCIFVFISPLDVDFIFKAFFDIVHFSRDFEFKFIYAKSTQTCNCRGKILHSFHNSLLAKLLLFKLIDTFQKFVMLILLEIFLPFLVLINNKFIYNKNIRIIISRI